MNRQLEYAVGSKAEADMIHSFMNLLVGLELFQSEKSEVRMIGLMTRQKARMGIKLHGLLKNAIKQGKRT